MLFLKWVKGGNRTPAQQTTNYHIQQLRLDEKINTPSAQTPFDLRQGTLSTKHHWLAFVHRASGGSHAPNVSAILAVQRRAARVFLAYADHDAPRGNHPPGSADCEHLAPRGSEPVVDVDRLHSSAQSDRFMGFRLQPVAAT